MNNTSSRLLIAVLALVAGTAIGWKLPALLASPGQAPHGHAHDHAEAGTAPAAGERKILYWYDPMVPTQKFDKPGKSPFMDMQLVPRYADEGDAAQSGVAISPEAVQALGVRTAPVEKAAVGASIDAVGSLQLNERDVSIVQARAGGFVERVHPHAPGDVVTAGAPLAELLLPDWVAAQREFLAVRAMRDEGITAAARQRLLLLGMSAAQIAQVERTGQPEGHFSAVAPAGGVIAELMVRQGMTVSPGMSLARINGIASLWLDVAVPEAHAAALRASQAVEARLAAFPGEVFRGKVAAILPEGNKDSRTLRVRVELPNPGNRLKAGMFAQVALRGPQAQALLVPADAIIRTGKRAIAYVVDGPGRYHAVEVETGAEVDGKLVILRGLEPGEEVVASAQFLVDSEASLRGVIPQKPAESKP